jgi:hypothetical protein
VGAQLRFEVADLHATHTEMILKMTNLVTIISRP